MRKVYSARRQLQTVGIGDSANRLVDYYEYDPRGMMRSINHLKTTESANGPSLAYRRYWRDSRDRITAWQRGTVNSPNGKETGTGSKFQYDAEGQLTDAWYVAQIVTSTTRAG